MLVNKKIKIIFSSEAETTYVYLIERSSNYRSEKIILEAINKKIEFLRNDVHYGRPISKKLIPKEYKLK